MDTVVTENAGQQLLSDPYQQSNNEVSVMLEFRKMRSTPLLPSLLGPFWPRVLAPDRVQSMGLIKLFDI